MDRAIGAYVPAVALANNSDEFTEIVATTLNGYGFDVLNIEDIEPFEESSQHPSCTPDLLALARQLTAESPAAVGTFHSYRK